MPLYWQDSRKLIVQTLTKRKLTMDERPHSVIVVLIIVVAAMLLIGVAMSISKCSGG